MSAPRLRLGRLASGLAVAACALGVACIDLFHSTEFETLCDRDPTNAACAASADASAADVVVEPPDLCKVGGTNPERTAERACGWLGACAGPLDSSRFGPCVLAAKLAFDCTTNPALRPRGDVAALWACLASVTSCGDVDRCIFRGPPPKCTELTTGSFVTCDTSDAGVRVKCAAGTTDRPVTAEPCLLFGKTCTVLDSSRAACTAGQRAACGGVPGCNLTSASVCQTVGQDRLDVGVDCAGYGTGSCVAGACTGTSVGGPCKAGAEQGLVTCEGDIAHVCVGSSDTPIACGRLGLGCDASKVKGGFPQAACVQTSDAAPPCTDEDACKGNTLESCANGKYQIVDCSALGLGPCTQIATGAARCSTP